jgi:tetratricopeptide (TPR) repeat protein
VLEVDGATCSPCAASSASTARCSSGPSWCRCSRCSSTSSRRSASASRCCSRSRRSRRSTSSSPTSPRCAWSRSSRSTRPTSRASRLLERCYRRLRQWHDLINTYDRHINATLDRQKKIELWTRDGHVYADELEDVEKRDRRVPQHRRHRRHQHPRARGAREALREAGRRAQRHRLHDARRGPHDRRQAARRDVLPHRPQLDEKLGDRDAAQERFEMALDLDPTHLPTLAALRAIAIDAADWDRAARYLDQEQINTEAPRRAKLLVELGKLRDEMLGEHDLAVQAYELALQSDADNEDAALPLVERVRRDGAVGRAEPLAEMLVKKAASASARSSTLCRTLRQGARRAREERGRAQGVPGGAPARSHRSRRRSAASPRCASSSGLARLAHELPEGAHALGEERPSSARRLLQARLHQAGSGPGQAGDQQLREGAAASIRRTAPRSRRWSRSTTSRRTSSRSATTSADPRQRDRRRGALQDARRDRRHLGRQGAREDAEGHRGL